MNKELKKIKPEDIYVSRLKGKRVRNEEGWERMEELPHVFQPLGDPLLDCVGELLLNGPIPTVQQLAESLNATVRELNVYFGLRTGMGAREFLSAYKMLIAKELLSSTNLTIEEIGKPMVNTVMLGALIKCVDIVPYDALEDQITDRFTGKLSDKVIVKNLSALKRGFKEVQ